MTQVNESMAFRIQNLARKAMIKAATPDFGSNLSRDERFKLYKEVDKKITDEAFKLLKEHGGEVESYFDQAAVNVMKTL